jgi:hypothetical protein
LLQTSSIDCYQMSPYDLWAFVWTMSTCRRSLITYYRVATVTSGDAVNHWVEDVFRHFPLWALELYRRGKIEIAARPCTKMRNHLGIKKLDATLMHQMQGANYTVVNINCKRDAVFYLGSLSTLNSFRAHVCLREIGLFQVVLE